MPRNPRVPKYRRHSSGQARVTFNGKDHLLGHYGSAESKEAYRRLVTEWLARHGQPEPKREGATLSVNDLILAYWGFASDYYGFGDGNRGDSYCLKDALRVVRALYGHTAADGFGPLALKACRRQMVEKGWSRTYTNAQVDRVRRMFRWAAGEELLPGSVYENLRVVTGLRAGKTEARETEKVRPAPTQHIDATLPHMPPAVRAMVRLQLLTGCRPDEVCRLRPLDLDTSNPACWVYRPGSDRGAYGEHKTAHHEHDHLVLIGPRAQEVLRPYLGTAPDVYCFSPAGGEAARAAERRKSRNTPLYPSHVARLAAKRQRAPRRPPGERYDTPSYRRAIKRACDKAFPLPAHLGPRTDVSGKKESQAAWWARLTVKEREVVRAWRREHRWHPNQLRHTRATELRHHGLDIVKTILGHRRVETTQIYSEKDLAAAMELMAKIG
jgi:integrase